MNVEEAPQPFRVDCYPTSISEITTYPHLVQSLSDLKLRDGSYKFPVYYDSVKNVELIDFLNLDCCIQDFIEIAEMREKINLQRIHTILDTPTIYKVSNKNGQICPLLVFTATENGDEAPRFMIPLFELCQSNWHERPFQKILNFYNNIKNQKIGLVCYHLLHNYQTERIKRIYPANIFFLIFRNRTNEKL